MKRIVLIGASILFLVAGMTTMSVAAEFELGGGIGVAPDYEGSDDYEAVPVPYGEVVFDNGMYISLQGLHLKANLIPTSWLSWLRVGPSYNYIAQRSDVENDEIDKFKTVSDANMFGAFGGIEYNNFYVFLEFLSDLGDANDGWTGELTAGYNWVINQQWALSFGAHGKYADDDYMDTYFGVDSEDASRSGLSTYEADSSFYKYGLDVGANWRFLQNWNLKGLTSFSNLTGDADDDSPVVDEGSEFQFFGAVLVTYSF